MAAFRHASIRKILPLLIILMFDLYDIDHKASEYSWKRSSDAKKMGKKIRVFWSNIDT